MENTPQYQACQETPLESVRDSGKAEPRNEVLRPKQKDLSGLPVNLLSRDSDIQEFMGVSKETFGLWVEAAKGLNLAIGIHVGTKEGWSLTADIHELFRAQPKLGVRPSVVRNNRIRERKRRE